MNRKLTLSLVACFLAALMATTICAAASSTSLLNYQVCLQPSGSGQLYWNYGKNMTFFLSDSSDSYNQNCRIKSGTTYSFSRLTDRGILVEPDDDWYFDGFYTKAGLPVNLTKRTISIIRVTVDGLYYYDYVTDYADAQYARYTRSAYEKEVQSYVKTLYGTKKYKVLRTTTLYLLPKKTQDLYPRFSPKALPDLSLPETMTKVYGSSPFYAIPDLDENLGAVFRSSSSKLLTVDSKSGLCRIKGEGIAIISVHMPATETTLEGKWQIRLYLYPNPVTVTEAVKKSSSSDTSLTVKWKADPKCTGYEIQVASDADFSNIVAKKTIASAKTASTTLSISKKTASSASCKYLRIRPVKKSRNEKLYGAYTVCKIS